jgi:NADH:ubiquinone oxidoreductase subunit 6 (subunit J)
MKKYLKVMLVLVVALSMLCSFALAANDDNPFKPVIDQAAAEQNGTIGNAVNNIGATVIKVIQTVGYVIAVVMVLVLAIQWLIGTPAKKQELKGKMWNIIIGAVLLVAGVSVLGVLADFAKDVEDDLNGVSSLPTVEVRA